MADDENNPFSDSYDPIAHGVDPLSEWWLRNRQLMASAKAGIGYTVRNLETGEVEVVESTVNPETKEAAGGVGFN